MVRSQKGGRVKKRVGPLERGGKSAKRREKRETNTIKIGGSKDESRGKRKERREQRQERRDHESSG